MNQKFGSNEYLENIRMYCSYLREQDMFHIIINEETISIPVEVAATLSSTITKKLKLDPTLRQIQFHIQFRDKDSIINIKNLLEGKDISIENISNRNSIYDLCDFFILIGNSLLISWLFDNKNIDEDLSEFLTKEIVDQVIIKCKISHSTVSINLSPNITSYEKELAHIAKNFNEFSNDEYFLKWAKNVDNLNILEQLLKREDLSLQDEDSLLSFLIELFKTNNIYSILFQYCYIEYCSNSIINAFIETINESNIFELQSQISIFNCLARRCTKTKYQNPPYYFNRYKKMNIQLPFNQNYPLKGIFNYANNYNNLSLVPSSINYQNDPKNGDVYTIIHMKDDTYFLTLSRSDSFIEGSLKDKSLFIVTDYLIRNNTSISYHLQTWVLEGQEPNTYQWVTLDSRYKEPFTKSQAKLFHIDKSVKIQKVRLRQTGTNADDTYYLCINGFEVYGEVLNQKYYLLHSFD